MAAYANEWGDPAGRPYFALPGGSEWEWGNLRPRWNHQHGLTNVWQSPPVRGSLRLSSEGKSFHPNQKPHTLMERLVLLSTNPGDVVWEPFGGLCTASLASARHGREAYVSEASPEVYRVAKGRVQDGLGEDLIRPDSGTVLSLYD
jgi:site-specific DNA-methyltransferase (adenine-specific)